MKQELSSSPRKPTIRQELRGRLLEMYTQDPMRRFNRLMGCLTGSLLLIVAGLMPLANLRSSQFYFTLVAPLIIGGVAVWAQVVSFTRLRDAMLLFFGALLITVGVGALVWVVARTPAPLIDSHLAAIDRAMGLETRTVVRAVSFHPHLARALAVMYGWLIPFSLVALMLPVFLGLREPPQRLVIGYAAAALITTAVFALLPAAGPWTVYPLTPTHEQMVCQTTLAMLKTRGPLREEIAHTGLVAFPSFHVAQCVLVAIAFWHSRWLRVPAAAVATLICISTVTTGWHYVIDVIGGVAVAVISQVLAVWVFEHWVQSKGAGGTE